MTAWMSQCRCGMNMTTTGACTCYDTSPTWNTNNYVLAVSAPPPTPPPLKPAKMFVPPKNHKQQREWWNN